MAAVEAEVSAEILEALASTRRELALLEKQLTPRWEAEAKALAGLENDRDRVRAKVCNLRARFVESTERQKVLQRELEQLEVGLSRAGQWQVRILEPLVLSLSLLAAILAAGLTGTSKWPTFLVTLAVGFGLGRWFWSRRG